MSVNTTQTVIVAFDSLNYRQQFHNKALREGLDLRRGDGAVDAFIIIDNVGSPQMKWIKENSFGGVTRQLDRPQQTVSVTARVEHINL